MEKIEHIKVEYSTESLFGSADAEVMGADESASVRQYGESLEVHLADAYPGAEIEVVHGINDRIWINGWRDHDEIDAVKLIEERVYNGDDWLVAAKDEDSRVSNAERTAIWRESGIRNINVLREERDQAGYPHHLLRGYDDSDVEWRGWLRDGMSAADITWDTEDEDGWAEELSA